MYQELSPALTPEHAAVRDAAHQFAAKVLRPTAAALDRLPDPAVGGEPARRGLRVPCARSTSSGSA
jgi:hypothetical protein